MNSCFLTSFARSKLYSLPIKRKVLHEVINLPTTITYHWTILSKNDNYSYIQFKMKIVSNIKCLEKQSGILSWLFTLIKSHNLILYENHSSIANNIIAMERTHSLNSFIEVHWFLWSVWIQISWLICNINSLELLTKWFHIANGKCFFLYDFVS